MPVPRMREYIHFTRPTTRSHNMTVSISIQAVSINPKTHTSILSYFVINYDHKYPLTECVNDVIYHCYRSRFISFLFLILQIKQRSFQTTLLYDMLKL